MGDQYETNHEKREEGTSPSIFTVRNGLRNGLMVLGAASMLAACGTKAVEQTRSTGTATAAAVQRSTMGERVTPSVADEQALAREAVAAGRNLDLRGTAAMFVSSSELSLERYQEGGERRIRAILDVSGSNLQYNWLFYQDTGQGNQLLMNPNYEQTGQPRYIGTVMRNITLTDGRTGDFTVRVRSSGLTPSQGPEYVPMVEPNGRVRPENVLYALETGSLIPDVNTVNFSETCMRTSVPQASVRELGQTTPVVLIRQE